MANVDKRLSDLENRHGGGDEIKVSLNWGEPGMVMDDDTGEYVTEQEWRKRHPKDRLIIVGLDDDYEQELDPIPVG